jgi:ketosteroid isomerase-like protein
VRTSLKAILLGLSIVTLRAEGPAYGQMLNPNSDATSAPNPLTDPTVKPGKMILFDLEARFAKDVLARGGAAVADWFAEDGVALGNGQAPVVGKVAIAKSAAWDPKVYQLTWTPTDATMGPSGDVGYTWGHFEGHSKDANGNHRALHHDLAQTARRQLEGRVGRGRQ